MIEEDEIQEETLSDRTMTEAYNPVVDLEES